jgi:hypothetical protein
MRRCICPSVEAAPIFVGAFLAFNHPAPRPDRAPTRAWARAAQCCHILSLLEGSKSRAIAMTEALDSAIAALVAAQTNLSRSEPRSQTSLS